MDVTARDQVRRFVAETASHFGRVDICVANVGGPRSKSLADTSIEEWHRAAELNLMSTVYLAREALPLMQERRWGRFIAITSVNLSRSRLLDRMALILFASRSSIQPPALRWTFRTAGPRS